jgi:TonB family protein
VSVQLAAPIARRATACLLALAAAALLGPRALVAQGTPPAARSAPSAGGLLSGVLAGFVRDDAGVAVSGAQVSLVGILGRGASGSDGSFRLSGPVGPRTLVVRRIGFRPESLAVTLDPGGLTEVTVRLAASVQQLTPLVVEAGRPRYTGRLGPFYERRDRGMGRYFTAEDIDRRNPHVVSDLIRTVPGARVTRRGAESVITFRGQSCTPLVWIDGTPAATAYLDPDLFAPNSLAGIEVYSGPATIPVELTWARGRHACGVIALWTRLDSPRGRQPRRQVSAQDLANAVQALRLYTADQVDVAAAPDSAAPVQPFYPDSMLREGIEGRVLVEFVVDSSGEPEMDTFGEVLSTNVRFTDAVRRAVGQARFTPAVVGGRKVRQLVQLPFRFVVPPKAGADQ